VKLVAGNVSGWVPESDIVALNHAVDFYTGEIKSDPGNCNAYYFRGLVWESQAEYGNAISDFNRAIQLDPKKLSQYCYAACSLFTLRYHNNAQANWINPR
jgi:tetratricopeptide (TPR) repeat protein